MSKFYVVSAVMPWKSIRLNATGQGLHCDDKDVAGYMVVFTTRAGAEAYIESAGPDVPVGRADVLDFESGAATDDDGGKAADA